ncbi:hypothetical protein POM88_023265 [Heracleum sosnowskyi]|uniref:Uncharacterized protein n=1 Tax=Heracleum sosnowskyi TaxID=360622 RepID=A0AAD8MQB4_9APIA|nr:hypothetical protein POM88_023265 [Heracleum sosnowskyi]
MLQERVYAAVFCVDGKIYVFGGLAPLELDSSPWAEFLDTSMPKEEQQWKALPDPVIRACSRVGCTKLVACPCDSQTILIGCGIRPKMDGVLHNLLGLMAASWWPMSCTHNFADIVDIVFTEDFFMFATSVPHLVHLEDNLFGFFNLLRLCPQEIGVVGCTKVVVSKGCPGMNDYPGRLELRVVGYEAYRCDPIYRLSGVVSMHGSKFRWL